MLRRNCSEPVSYALALTPEEAAQLERELPRQVCVGLKQELDLAGVALRYDASGRCAYYIAREQSGLVVWTWCDMGLRASARLLSELVDFLGPMDEQLA